jgi:hypothetical protein
MVLLERSADSVFGSKSLIGHLLRGLTGFVAVYWAFTHQSEPVLSVLAVGAAFVLFRRCPVCWAVGLMETIAGKLRG